jgi:hypothetical protein
MAVRDSEDADGAKLTFTVGQWRAFVTAVTNGRRELVEHRTGAPATATGGGALIREDASNVLLEDERPEAGPGWLRLPVAWLCNTKTTGAGGSAGVIATRVPRLEGPALADTGLYPTLVA